MAWTNVNKPSETTTDSGTAGMPIGMLAAITYSDTTSSVITGWGNVAKSTASVYTNVAKSTASVWTNVTKPT